MQADLRKLSPTWLVLDMFVCGTNIYPKLVNLCTLYKTTGTCLLFSVGTLSWGNLLDFLCSDGRT